MSEGDDTVRLSRPSVYQYASYRWYDPQTDLELVGQWQSACQQVVRPLAAHVHSHLLAAEQTQLEEQLPRIEAAAPDPDTARMWIGVGDLGPRTGYDLPVRAQLQVRQEGDSLLLLLAAYWDVSDVTPEQATEQLQGLRWAFPADADCLQWGTWLLWSGIAPLQEGEGARRLLVRWGEPEAPLTPLPLPFGTLHIDLGPRLVGVHPLHRRAVLWLTPQTEESPELVRLWRDQWPLLALYQHKADYFFWRDYRALRIESLRRGRQRLEEALLSTRSVLHSPHPAPLQKAVVRVDRPYGDHNVRYAAATELLAAAQINLENLARVTRRIVAPRRNERAVATSGAMLAATAEALQEQARRDVRQLEADLRFHRLLLERADRAVDILRTQADILEAQYERWLILAGSFLGSVLAAAELIGNEETQMLWHLLPRVAPDAQLSHFGLLGARVLIMLLIGLLFSLLAWLLVSIAQRRPGGG